MPVFFKNLLHFFGGAFGNRSTRGRIESHAKDMIAALVDNLLIVLFDVFFPFWRHGLLHRGHHEVWCALKNRHAGSGFSHLGQHLHSGSTRTNNANTLTRKFKSLRPTRRMKTGTFEGSLARNVGNLRL